ncbi:hypothetical protein ACFLYB_05305 [Chloroflexota bacterium]
MKRILYLALVVALLSTPALMVSACGKEDLGKMPFGEVRYWNHELTQEVKNTSNVIIDPTLAPPISEAGSGQYYEGVFLKVIVVNKGANGILTFHAVCNLKTIGKSQYAQNITLKENEEGEIIFRFWVDLQDVWGTIVRSEWSQAFTVQAVNL